MDGTAGFANYGIDRRNGGGSGGACVDEIHGISAIWDQAAGPGDDRGGHLAAICGHGSRRIFAGAGGYARAADGSAEAGMSSISRGQTRPTPCQNFWMPNEAYQNQVI